VPIDARGDLRLSVHGVPEEGVQVELEMADRWPVEREVVEVAYGLPPASGPERPAARIPRPGWWPDTTMSWDRHTLRAAKGLRGCAR
jgi:hypothetical protein